MMITDRILKYYYAKYYLIQVTEDGKIYIKYFETASDLKAYCNELFKGDFKTVKSIYEFVRFFHPLGDFELFAVRDILSLVDFILTYDGVTDAVKLTALKDLFC